MRRATAVLVSACVLGAWTKPALSLTAVEVYARVSPSVWKVVLFDGQGRSLGLGSAVVGAPEVMVTNCHVVEKAERVQVRRELSILAADVELWDRERDLCQLKVPGLTAPAVQIRESARVQVGQTVYAIGTPHGLDLTMSSGLLSAIRRDKSGRIQRIQTSAAISGGSSGGGLFDDEGALVGLTTSGIVGDAQNLNFAIPADWIRELWQRHGRLYPPPPTPEAPVVVAAAPTVPAPARTPAAAVRTPAPAPAPEPAPVPVPVPSLPPAAVVPIAVSPPAVGIAALRPGDAWEYSIVDGFTGRRRSAVYRVDRVDAGEVVYNGGARAETLEGQVVRIVSPIGGDMDSLSPPGGWLTRELWLRARWNIKFQGNDPEFQRSLDLQGVVQGNQKISTPAGDFDTIVVSYSGWGRREGQINSFVVLKVDVKLWYAPALRRVVRFQSDVRPSTNGSSWLTNSSRETAELTRISRR